MLGHIKKDNGSGIEYGTLLLTSGAQQLEILSYARNRNPAVHNEWRIELIYFSVDIQSVNESAATDLCVTVA